VYYKAFVVVTRRKITENSVPTVTNWCVPPMICGSGFVHAIMNCAKPLSLCCLSGVRVDHHYMTFQRVSAPSPGSNVGTAAVEAPPASNLGLAAGTNKYRGHSCTVLLVSSVQHPRQKRKRREKYDCEREREEEENFQLSSVHLWLIKIRVFNWSKSILTFYFILIRHLFLFLFLFLFIFILLFLFFLF
jgi:hypothetical protein